ncbi:MAG: phosphoribosylaminoimidazolesuccinocarboxamide synthase [Sulfolobales archaeon]|nr:phosphoribosylaminoimidazolesuccinocarboxamide synthase [Sulfolobales archaeon]MDW7968902.1 phosphoribosylaminoimidazolesuccinocarboxamide synthase [Sulfolobales archaeon]
MENLRLIYDGKTKRVYVKSDDMLLMEFKDVVTALDGAKVTHAAGKGVLNAALTAYFFKLLKSEGIDNHFIHYDGERSVIVKKLSMIPAEVVVRNYAYGGLVKRLPLLKPLTKLNTPTVEFHYKSDELHDPLILSEDLINAGLVSPHELEVIKEVSLKVNDVLLRRFDGCGLLLLDFKLEFGRDSDGKVLLADEICGDSVRVIDSDGRHLDKEVFRRGGSVDDLVKAYTLLACKLGIDVRGFQCT